ncbi:MAG: tetratricopeptide repeat protein, partial [Candidatus Thorarchaeota archaeon]
HEESEEALKTAIELNPDYTLAWGNLGELLYNNERHEEAEMALRKVTELSPDDLEYWRKLGDVLLKLGREDEAAEAFDKVESDVSGIEEES